MAVYDAEFKNSLVTLMNHVLDTVVSVFEQAGIELPARRFIASGTTVHDKEQVTVSLQQLYLGPPGEEAQTPQPCNGPRTAVLLVEIVRCVPQPDRTGAPSPEALQACAEQQAIDAYMLLEAGANTVDEFDFGVLADVAAGEAGGAVQAMQMNLILMVP